MRFGPEAMLGGVSRPGGVIDFRLARRALVDQFRRGRLARHDVCDAHAELLRAAATCSRATAEDCPICESAKLVLVTYVFGPRLPSHGRCISAKRELVELGKREGPFTVYVVEVCASCSWNFLDRTYPLGRRSS
ncbi:MAG: DUF5318 family protein [Acidimicrobiales bacterium]